MSETIQRVYQLIIDAGGSKAGAEIFRQSAEKIDAAAQKAAAAGKPITDNLAQQARAYERLRREIDPLYAAEVRLAQGLQLLETRFRTGNISAEELSRDVAALKGQFDRAAESARRMGAVAGTGAGTYRNLGTAFQQAGYQVGDFAVQIASGQGILRPFIQQGTQLISMFGPWGAVIGAAGAVVGALATAFWEVEDSAEAAEAALKVYEDALQAAVDLNKELNGSFDRTVESLQAEKRYRLELAEAELAAVQIKMALLHATVAEEAVQQSPDDIGRALDNIEQSLKPRMDALKAVLNGDGTDENPGLRKIIAELKYGGGGLDGRSNMGLDFGNDYTVPSSKSSKTDPGADAVASLQQKIALYGDLTNEEKALYETTLGRYKDESAAEKEQIVQLSRILDLKDELAAATKEQADAAAALNKSEVASYDSIIDETSRAWETRVKAGQKLTEEVRTPLEAYLARISDLNVALSVGTINQETYNRQVAKAQDSFDDASDGATLFRDAADDAMGILQAGLFDAAFAADNLNEALRGVLISLAKMAANKAFGAIADKGLDALFSLFGSGPSVAASTGMSTTAANGWSAFINHSGGTAGRGAMRSVDPSWFSAAPRFHGGGTVPGLGPNEVPIIAEQGETIRTRSQEAALQGRMGGGRQGSVINISAPITIEGGGGTPEQNTDLATKVVDQFERSFRGLIREELADNQRSGGALNPGMGF